MTMPCSDPRCRVCGQPIVLTRGGWTFSASARYGAHYRHIKCPEPPQVVLRLSNNTKEATTDG
jgi:hypothetical protein